MPPTNVSRVFTHDHSAHPATRPGQRATSLAKQCAPSGPAPLRARTHSRRRWNQHSSHASEARLGNVRLPSRRAATTLDANTKNATLGIGRVNVLTTVRFVYLAATERRGVLPRAGHTAVEPEVAGQAIVDAAPLCPLLTCLPSETVLVCGRGYPRSSPPKIRENPRLTRRLVRRTLPRNHSPNC